MKKKIFITLYIIILTISALFVAKKILAATEYTGNEYEEATWGKIEVVEDKTKREPVSGMVSSGISSKSTINASPRTYIDYQRLINNFTTFCIAHRHELDSSWNINKIISYNLNVLATKDAEESFVGEKVDGILPWDQAYILAKTKASYGGTEYNPAQLALWAVLRRR